jgi:hypothetical protein
MNRLIVLAVFFLPVIAIHANSNIRIHPDSLYFPSDAIDPFSDSLSVSNIGSSELQIDSTINKSHYGYSAVYIQGNNEYWFSMFNSQQFPLFTKPIVLEPLDSLLLIVYSPDLCPICKNSESRYYFTDSLFIFSNDSSNSPITIKTSGWATQSGVENDVELKNINSELYPNYPNPFNNSTVIRYHLPKSSDVRLSIYDINGGLVLNLVDVIQPSGLKEISWDGKNHFGDPVSSGVYCLMLSTDRNRLTRKILYIK